MVIRAKKQSEIDKEFNALGPSERIYTDTELRDFHKKIQRFWEPYTMLDGTVTKRFNWEELEVAYGSARIVMCGQVKYYIYNPERSAQFSNLRNQYESLRKREDWIETRRIEGLELTAEKLSTV